MEQVPPTKRDSYVGIRPDVVMLVRIEPWEESMLLLRDLNTRVVRVRHPLPACERMRVQKPAVIIVGASVRAQDFELIVDEAYELRAAVLQVGQVPSGKLRMWIATALDKVRQRRQEEAAQEEAEAELQAG
jgi:hypothetical protein